MSNENISVQAIMGYLLVNIVDEQGNQITNDVTVKHIDTDGVHSETVNVKWNGTYWVFSSPIVSGQYTYIFSKGGYKSVEATVNVAPSVSSSTVFKTITLQKTTISSELTRISNAKTAIKTAIEAKGVTVGDGTIDTYAEKIGEISTGGNSYTRVNIITNNPGHQYGDCAFMPTMTSGDEAQEYFNIDLGLYQKDTSSSETSLTDISRDTQNGMTMVSVDIYPNSDHPYSLLTFETGARGDLFPPKTCELKMYQKDPNSQTYSNELGELKYTCIYRINTNNPNMNFGDDIQMDMTGDYEYTIVFDFLYGSGVYDVDMMFNFIITKATSSDWILIDAIPESLRLSNFSVNSNISTMKVAGISNNIQYPGLRVIDIHLVCNGSFPSTCDFTINHNSFTEGMSIKEKYLHNIINSANVDLDLGNHIFHITLLPETEDTVIGSILIG